MSLGRGSLRFISHSGLKHCEFWLPRAQLLPRALPLRVSTVVRFEGRPYPAGEVEVSSTGLASVGLNQVAPPVGNVFGKEVKEVDVLEDPVGFIKGRLERRAQSVKQAFESVEDAVAPSPYSPVQGNDVVVFFFVSVFLVSSFWVGNYAVPTWIFKDTVFGNSNDEEGYVPEEEKPSEEDVDPADLIELPPNLLPFREAAVAGFKAGRQRARDAAEKRRKKAEKSE